MDVGAADTHPLESIVRITWFFDRRIPNTAAAPCNNAIVIRTKDRTSARRCDQMQGQVSGTVQPQVSAQVAAQVPTQVVPSHDHCCVSVQPGS